MSTIVTRAGKGSALTHTELDTNLNNLNTDKLEAADIAGKSDVGHTHTLAEGGTDVTISAANLNALDDGIDTTLHFHDTDRARANHTGTQTASTISDFSTAADARIAAASINALSDVVVTTPSNGQVLKYNGTNWINDTDATGGGGGALDDLTDVVLTAPSNGQVLKYNGTNWINDTDATGGGGSVTAAGTPVNNQIAVWTGSTEIEGDASLTFDTTTDTLAVGASGKIAFGAVNILDDSAGATTLSNIDALDATTEATIEAAIDTLANLTSIQGRTVTLADAGADALLGWDDSANAYQNLSAADARTALGLTALATTTPGTGVATFLGTPSSANLAAAVTDETGSGALVFATSPALTTPNITGGTAIELTGFSLRSTGAAFDMLQATSEVLTADRTLSWNVADGNRTVTLGANLTVNAATTISTAGAALIDDPTADDQRTTLSAAARAQTSQFSFYVSTVADGDVVTIPMEGFAGTVTKMTTDCTSGTCTLTGKVNSTAWGGTANSVSTTKTSQTHSSANTWVAGDDLVFTASSNSACLGMRVTVTYTRTLD